MGKQGTCKGWTKKGEKCRNLCKIGEPGCFYHAPVLRGQGVTVPVHTVPDDEVPDGQVPDGVVADSQNLVDCGENAATSLKETGDDLIKGQFTVCEFLVHTTTVDAAKKMLVGERIEMNGRTHGDFEGEGLLAWFGVPGATTDDAKKYTNPTDDTFQAFGDGLPEETPSPQEEIGWHKEPPT